MAKEIKVIIGADTKPLKAGLADAQRDLKGFGSFATGLVAGFGVGVFQAASSAISGFFAGAQQEALESQRAINSIRQSLESAGRTDLFSGLIKKANELQSQFKFLDNDDITASFQRLIQFGGLTEDQINKLIPVIIDLNAKQRLAGETNKSLSATAEQVIKGIEGQGRELKLYGVEVTAANSATQNLGIILDQLGGKVRGAADAFGNSLEGKLAATTQRAKDLQEELGNKLLPLKVSLISFAIEAAGAFETLYQKITGTFEATQRAAKSLEDLKKSKSAAKSFAENASNFLKAATDEQFNTFIDGFEKKIDDISKVLADGSAPFATNANKQYIQNNRDIIEALKEKRRLILDTSTVGTRVEKIEQADNKKSVDTIKVRIAALKELIAAEVDVSKNKLELKGLDIKLLLRDAKEKGFTEEEIKKLIFAKFPDFDGTGLTLSKPVDVSVPIKADIQQSVTGGGGEGDSLSKGLQRVKEGIEKSGAESLAKYKEDLEKASEGFNNEINAIIGDSIVGVGEAIGDIFSGKNPAAAAINIIAFALQGLGRALIAYGLATKAVKVAIASIFTNPFTAIAAGVAAVAAGTVLRSQINKVPQLAEGGMVSKATLAIIGERGPEVVVPLNRYNAMLGKNNGGGLQVQFIETKRRGEDSYEVWKIMNAKNNRLR